jgi:16S rRNA G966 N2-methylase RsmD
VPEDRHEIYCSEAYEFLRQTRSGPWDIIFFDPPYKDDYVKTLEFIGANASKLLAEDGLLIAEHHHKNVLPETIGSLRRTRVLKQGDSALSFYRNAD